MTALDARDTVVARAATQPDPVSAPLSGPGSDPMSGPGSGHRSATPPAPDADEATATAIALALAGRHPWMAEAACHGRTQLFFGIAGERPERRVRREARARKVCAGCPVIEPCREMARTNGENGFWGGESEEERAAAGWAPISISRRSVQEAAAGRLRAG